MYILNWDYIWSKGGIDWLLWDCAPCTGMALLVRKWCLCLSIKPLRKSRLFAGHHI